MEVLSAYSFFQERVSGGPKWTRTTDLAIISRALSPAELWALVIADFASFASAFGKSSLAPSLLLFGPNPLRWALARLEKLWWRLPDSNR